MVEFGPKPSEYSSPHEGEGLSLAHWELLAKTRFKDPKVNRFAQAVLSGKIDGSRNTYSQYLGKRHWSEIVSKMQGMSKGLPGRIRRSIKPELMPVFEEISNIASLESKKRYSLNDYFSGLGNSFSKGFSPSLAQQAADDSVGIWPHNTFLPSSSETVSWHSLSGGWSGKDATPRSQDIGGHIFVAIQVEELSEWRVVGFVLDKWLLPKELFDNLSKVIKLSPKELTKIARTIIPELLIEKLKERGYQNIRGWEKEI